jgi:hypothetical protein
MAMEERCDKQRLTEPKIDQMEVDEQHTGYGKAAYDALPADERLKMEHCTLTELPLTEAPPPLFQEPMSAAFAENLRRFVRCLPPEAAQEVLTEPLEDAGRQQRFKKNDKILGFLFDIAEVYSLWEKL